MNKNNDSVLIMEKALNIKDEVYVEKNFDIYFTEEELESKPDKPLILTENNDKKGKRKVTNNIILERIKDLNLKAKTVKKEKKEEMSEKEKKD